MIPEKKNWIVKYSHKDGRKGTVKASTEISKSGAFEYGNGKCGLLIVDGFVQSYDLRYCNVEDLHMTMLESYFGNGLVEAKEV